MKIYNLQSYPSMYIEDYGRKVVEVNPTTINNQNLKLQKEDLNKYCNTKEELEHLNKFYDITKGLIKFTKPNKVKELFDKIYE